MLDKLKITMIIGLVLGVIRVFLPDLPIPEDFEKVIEAVVNGIFVIIAVGIGWKNKESQAKVAALVTK